MSPEFLLTIILLLSILGKNYSVAIATTFVIFITLLRVDKFFPLLEKYTLTGGIILLSIWVLIPIAVGKIGVKEIFHFMVTPVGLIVILAGISVAVLAASGVSLLSVNPEMSTGIVVGSLIGVAFFHGLPVGPMIGAGIVAFILKIFSWISDFWC
ncbi:MAG: DUF441 domain-containing protein [Bacillota bacterium]|uniref:DUF441 domain-containing protein n=1 Tax=Thermanaerosceptrum fracticalcis TaxID=1712410 RepID=UPI0005510007|nr:DUF441 domain-containing protein [Thermanaerosceptrum fracticalcis]